MTGDLHLHSVHSDGAFGVRELLLRAKERGLSYVSVADLHTTAGTAEAVAAGSRIEITVVPGVEIVARAIDSDKELHILGYGYRLPADEIDRICAGAETHNEFPAASEAICAIHADGGYAVLAHPGQLDSYESIDALVSAGLDGIELYHPDHGPEDHRKIRVIAERHGLFLTGGSDGGGLHRGSHDIGDIRAPFGSLAHVLRHDDELVAWTESLVREAGAMARRAVLSEIDAELKGGDIRDIVTEHDMAIDRFLTDSIRSRFPTHGFVTEEHDHPPIEEGTPTWVIDPIDGTTNFVSTGTYFAVSLAYYRGRQPVFGFVYDVMSDELYLGIAGKGAFLNGRPLSRARGIGTGVSKTLADSVIECSLICSQRLVSRFNADVSQMGKAFRAQRAYGSSTIGICRIARGSLDIYVSCSLSIWDYAAACIVLAEANGTTMVEVRPGDLEEPGLNFHDDGRLVLAARDEKVADEVIDLLFPTDRPRMSALRLEAAAPDA